MPRVPFLCSRNRLRSPTAEAVFGGRDGIEADSVGLAPDADAPLTPEHLHWAEIVFVMEQAHKRKLTSAFAAHLKGKQIVCLSIPDD